MFNPRAYSQFLEDYTPRWFTRNSDETSSYSLRLGFVKHTVHYNYFLLDALQDYKVKFIMSLGVIVYCHIIFLFFLGPADLHNKIGNIKPFDTFFLK